MNTTEQENDKTSPMADDVKKFLEQVEEATETSSEDPIDQNELLDDNEFSLIEDDELNADDNPFPEPDLQPDAAFSQTMGTLNPTVTTNEGQTVEITEADKERYLRSLLLNKPVLLDVELYEGRFKLTCRAISTYEYQLVDLLGMKLFDTYGDATARALLPSKIHMWRMSLQVLKLNGVPCDFLEFKPEREKLNKHLEELDIQSEKIIGTMSTSLYNACRIGLNIFHTKLTKLDQLALARDFSTPVD